MIFLIKRKFHFMRDETEKNVVSTFIQDAA